MNFFRSFFRLLNKRQRHASSDPASVRDSLPAFDDEDVTTTADEAATMAKSPHSAEAFHLEADRLCGNGFYFLF
jgi:hypothetical protein